MQRSWQSSNCNGFSTCSIHIEYLGIYLHEDIGTRGSPLPLLMEGLCKVVLRIELIVSHRPNSEMGGLQLSTRHGQILTESAAQLNGDSISGQIFGLYKHRMMGNPNLPRGNLCFVQNVAMEYDHVNYLENM